MIVVDEWSGEIAGAKISPNRGRRKVPAAFFAAHAGDSGRKGRITIKGIAGIRPEISVYRQAKRAHR